MPATIFDIQTAIVPFEYREGYLSRDPRHRPARNGMGVLFGTADWSGRYTLLIQVGKSLPVWESLQMERQR